MEKLPKDGLPINSDGSENICNIDNGENKDPPNNQSQQYSTDTHTEYNCEYIMNTLHTALGILKGEPTRSNIDGGQFEPAADGYFNEICDDLMSIIIDGSSDTRFTPPLPNIPSVPPPPPKTSADIPFLLPPSSAYGFENPPALTSPSSLPDLTFYLSPSLMPVRRLPYTYNLRVTPQPQPPPPPPEEPQPQPPLPPPEEPQPQPPLPPPEEPQPQPSPPPPQEPQPPVSDDCNPSAAPSRSSRHKRSRHRRRKHHKG